MAGQSAPPLPPLPTTRQAIKVLGDPNVPAGEVSWVCSAAPLPQPWADEEAAIIARRDWFALMAETAANHWHLEELEAEQQQQQQPGEGAVAEGGAAAAAGGAAAAPGDAGVAQQHEGVEAAPAPAPQAAAAALSEDAREARRRGKRVVACHAGRGRVAEAGFTEPSWVEGRLFVYSDGTCGFLWLDHFGFLIDCERLEV
jgi:hypothetical protein